METEYLNDEQQAELDKFDEKQRQRYEKGRLFIYLIAGFNILFDIMTIFISNEFEFLKFLIHIALSAALIYGVSWVRYLYAITGILSILLIIPAIPNLISLLQISSNSGIYLIVIVLTICYSAATSAILLFSKSVQEYMYKKKSERL